MKLWWEVGTFSGSVGGRSGGSVSVEPHDTFYTLVTRTRIDLCCECKNLLANDVSVKLYCSPTDVCL